jgi:hypothetical protein
MARFYRSSVEFLQFAQHYSNPKRAKVLYSLPDIEVWQDAVWHVECRCGEYEIPEPALLTDVTCPSCERKPLAVGGISDKDGKPKLGWFWWFCFPGDLPDGDPNGPFDTEQAALDDARSGLDD